jgi:hypothetical protein
LLFSIVLSGVGILAAPLLLIASCMSFVSIQLSGDLSDKIGRRGMYISTTEMTGVFGLLYYGLLDSEASSLVFMAIVLSLIPHDTMYCPQTALIGEALALQWFVFKPSAHLGDCRGPCTLTGICHSSYAIAAYIVFYSVSGKDISFDHEAVRQQRLSRYTVDRPLVALRGGCQPNGGDRATCRLSLIVAKLA